LKILFSFFSPYVFFFQSIVSRQQRHPGSGPLTFRHRVAPALAFSRFFTYVVVLLLLLPLLATGYELYGFICFSPLRTSFFSAYFLTIQQIENSQLPNRFSLLFMLSGFLILNEVTKSAK